MPLGFNKLCEFEDFSDPELVGAIREVFRHEMQYFTPEFPRGAEYRKYWEIGMSVRALNHFGAMGANAKILGVAAGSEATVFFLTKYVDQVFATDLYMDPGFWEDSAPVLMLVAPQKFAPYDFRRDRLVVQHMDGRYLRYPDNTFDGIFSSGSIEHFGSMELIANAAYEMGRVLKPGGILTLSTEYKINGPVNGDGWDGLRFFSQEALAKNIVEASGLEMVDPFNNHLSQRTLDSKWELNAYGKDTAANLAKQGEFPRIGEIIWTHYPHIVVTHQGYTFGSVHLTLRKTANYPVMPNDWAKPSQATINIANELEAATISSIIDDDLLKKWAAGRLKSVKRRVGKIMGS